MVCVFVYYCYSKSSIYCFPFPSFFFFFIFFSSDIHILSFQKKIKFFFFFIFFFIYFFFFFFQFCRDALDRREVPPPWVPQVTDELDVGQIDATFTQEQVEDSPENSDGADGDGTFQGTVFFRFLPSFLPYFLACLSRCWSSVLI